MSKINIKLSDFKTIQTDGSQIIVCYGLKQVSGDIYECQEVVLPKTQHNQLTFDVVKEAIIADINSRVKSAIIGGFVWQDKPVWLSEENQLNFSQGVVPVTLKIGEQEDGTPIYHKFDTDEELRAFNDDCNVWKQQCLADGYKEKDSIDWNAYKRNFE